MWIKLFVVGSKKKHDDRECKVEHQKENGSWNIVFRFVSMRTIERETYDFRFSLQREIFDNFYIFEFSDEDILGSLSIRSTKSGIC